MPSPDTIRITLAQANPVAGYIAGNVALAQQAVEKIEADKKAKGGVPDAAGGGAAAGKSGKDIIDPELLKRETFREPFWRFSCVKPQGLLKRKLTTDDKKRDKYSENYSHDPPPIPRLMLDELLSLSVVVGPRI